MDMEMGRKVQKKKGISWLVQELNFRKFRPVNVTVTLVDRQTDTTKLILAFAISFGTCIMKSG